MDYEKYKGQGAGLDKIALKKIEHLLDSFDNNINILEFGSGQSTQFLIDYKLYTNKNIIIDSYDHDSKYSYQNTNNYNFLNLYIKPLISCSDINFNKQILNKIYDRTCFKEHILLPYNHPKFWRQKNCFYNIENNELKDFYNLIIIDGPNGNGRNIAYLHIINRVQPGTIIFIDDYNSRDNDFDYKFIENLKSILNVQELYTHDNLDNKDCWNIGGNFAIYKVL